MKRLRHPIRAIREPFGTAGLIVAMIALVAALGGTALAAAKLNSTQKKEVEKIAKKYAGKPGANGTAGAAGPQGPKGDAGAKGDTGPEGKQGAPGKSGTDGTDGEDGMCSEAQPECVAPHGATFTGAFFGYSAGLNENETARVAISFPLRVAGLSEPIEHTEIIAPNQPGNVHCPGSIGSPEAEPGFVCLYESQSVNAEYSGPSVALDFTRGMIYTFHPEAAGSKVNVGGMWAVKAQ